jgi:hypothetical protein
MDIQGKKSFLKWICQACHRQAFWLSPVLWIQKELENLKNLQKKQNLSSSEEISKFFFLKVISNKAY